MILDFNPLRGDFFVRVPRGSKEKAVLMQEHGFDLSTLASTAQGAVLFTKEQYAAVAFADQATPRAAQQLHGLIERIDLSWKLTSNAHIDCPSDQELYPFQKADIEYALTRKNALDGDQPGLGKTPTAICLANEMHAKRVLVICPASIRKQWAEKIRVWSTMKFPYHVHVILGGRSGVNPYAEWTVVSYEMARSPAIGRALAAGLYDLLILDEAHFLKTTDAERTRAVFGGGDNRSFAPLAERAGFTYGLTGTPLPNRPREAYTLARALCWDSIDWLSEDKFRERFNPSASGRTDEGKIYIDERIGRSGELQARMRANFMSRHLKRDAMPQLDFPVYDIIRLEKTQAVKAALEAESLLDIDPTKFDSNIAVLGQVSSVCEQMGFALAPQVADWVDELIDGGEEKLVVFGWHLRTMNYLEERWRKHGVVRYHAGRGAHNEEAKAVFTKNPDCKIIMGNILTLGTGTDGLQHVSNHALIAEPDWVPGNNVQCFDRLDRGGQKRKVQGDIFVAPGSIMEKILGIALKKLQDTHKALDKKGGL